MNQKSTPLMNVEYPIELEGLQCMESNKQNNILEQLPLFYFLIVIKNLFL